jgi:hypothetical protein
MNSAYIGDVTDFGKYGLLRRICGVEPPETPRLKLGVIWYLRPEPTFGYLASDSILGVRPSDLDGDLYSQLQRLSGARIDIKAVEDTGLLGSDAVFFNEAISPDRSARFTRAVRMVGKARCDLVFLDPDTGVDSDDVATSRHATFGEVATLRRAGVCVALIDFPGRTRRSIAQTMQRLISDSLSSSQPEPFGLRFRFGSGRYFLIAPCSLHEDALRRRTDRLVSEWSPVFERVS